MMALLDPGDEVLYPDPGISRVSSITLGLGAVPVPFELSNAILSARSGRNRAKITRARAC
jgi:aspartate/methionine/tyrosine aminotransferase